MSTYVLVPGACHGGWWYEPLASALQAAGHEAVAVTPAGLEETPKLDGPINLETHIAQVSRVISAMASDGESRRHLVLVGHSYAGAVVTAVADRLPDAVDALVYLDAFLPEDGDSCWSMTNDEQRDWYISGSARSGYGVDPLPFFDDRARPHPLASLVQQCTLSGRWRRVPTKIHAEALGWPGESPMAAAAQRARDDPDFSTVQWDSGHNVLAAGPEAVYELISPL